MVKKEFPIVPGLSFHWDKDGFKIFSTGHGIYEENRGIGTISDLDTVVHYQNTFKGSIIFEKGQKVETPVGEGYVASRVYDLMGAVGSNFATVFIPKRSDTLSYRIKELARVYNEVDPDKVPDV